MGRAVDATPLTTVLSAGHLSGFLRGTGSRATGSLDGPPPRWDPLGGALLCPAARLAGQMPVRVSSVLGPFAQVLVPRRLELQGGPSTLPLVRRGGPLLLSVPLPSGPSLARPAAPLVPASFRCPRPAVGQCCCPPACPSLRRTILSCQHPSDDSDPSSAGDAALPPVPPSGRSFVCLGIQLTGPWSIAVWQQILPPERCCPDTPSLGLFRATLSRVTLESIRRRRADDGPEVAQRPVGLTRSVGSPVAPSSPPAWVSKFVNKVPLPDSNPGPRLVSLRL